MTRSGDLRALVRLLRAECPPTWPVKVRRAKGDYWGRCNLITRPGAEPYFSIRLHPSLRDPALLHVLAHEWAHSLAWTSEHPSVLDHGPEWGLAMARCYQALTGAS